MHRTGAAHVAFAIALAAVAASGCGDGATLAIDAAMPDAGAMSIAAPQIPWLDPITSEGDPPIAPPVLRPCPAGWREVVTDTGIEACDPWPDGGPVECPVGHAHFLGEPGCAPVGDPCPAGDFPEGLPSGAIVRHVDAAATLTPDGTMARPFRTIAAALVGAAPGTIVAIAKGRYDERIVPPEGVVLWGACAAETVLTKSVAPPPTDLGGVLDVAAAAVAVRNVRIEDVPWVAVHLTGASTTLDLQGVVVSRATGQAIWARDGARLLARSLVVADTQPASDRRGGNAIGLEAAAAQIERAVILRNHSAGIVKYGAGELELRDVVVRNTYAQVSDGTGGYGILANGEAFATIERADITGNRTLGIGFGPFATHARVTDAIIAGTSHQLSDGSGGAAFFADMGTTVEMSRVQVRGGSGVGVMAGDGATVVLEDFVARDLPGSRAADANGAGILAGSETDPVSLTVRRAIIERSRHGIVAPGGVLLEIEDTVVRDLRPPAETDCCFAVGINVGPGLVTLRRVSVRGVRTIGVGASAATLTLEDVSVRDATANPAQEAFGVGLVGLSGATVEGQRFVAQSIQGVAMLLDGPTTARMSDVVLADSRPVDGASQFGEGLWVQKDASIELDRAVIARHLGFGAMALDRGTIVARDLRIADTARFACADAACADRAAGTGLAAVYGSSVRAERFDVGPAALCGVQVAQDSQMDLSLGTVHDAAIGACIQVPDFDTQRVADRVVYERNGASLQATSLPVPDPFVPITL